MLLFDSEYVEHLENYAYMDSNDSVIICDQTIDTPEPV